MLSINISNIIQVSCINQEQCGAEKQTRKRNKRKSYLNFSIEHQLIFIPIETKSPICMQCLWVRCGLIIVFYVH